jgi:3-isopropylmalate dehydrogenase
VNFTVVRELTGGLYFGEKKEDDGSGYAYDVEPYHRHEIERVVRMAGYLAMQEDPPAPVWSLDKANVLATSRLWRKTVDNIMTTEFKQLKYGHHLIDSAAMLMIKNPRALNGIIVTSNLFGDIISDEASVIPGSLGLLPSASLGAIPTGKEKVNGIYEPIHGMYSSSRISRGLTLTVDRFRPRYLWKGHCKSRSDDPLGQHDAEIFSLRTRACCCCRQGCEKHH